LLKFTCPAGYDPYNPEAKPATECDPVKDPVTFSLTAWQKDAKPKTATGTQAKPNTVKFTAVKAGSYVVTETPPKDQTIASAFILTCKSSVNGNNQTSRYPLVFIGADLKLALDIHAGETLTCSWYNVPKGNDTVSFVVHECPGKVANPSRCAVATKVHNLEFTQDDESQTVTKASSDATGKGTVTLVPGTYKVSEPGGNVCLVDSDASNDEGDLVITDGDEFDADIYSCAAA